MSRCANCLYSPGTHGDENCPFDCGAMAAGYLTTRLEPSEFVVGRAYPANHFGYVDNTGRVIVNTNPIPVFAEPSRKGWICPKCDNAVSPDEKTCPHCQPKPKKESDNGERTHITETD